MDQPLPEPQETLVKLANDSNEKLDTAGQVSANHAFNLGCSISLLPGLLILILVFFLSRSSWTALAVSGVLIVVAGIGFANLAAFTAKGKAIDRAYELNINPEIERSLKRMEITRSDFDQIANSNLPEGAALRRYCAPSIPQEETKSKIFSKGDRPNGNETG